MLVWELEIFNRQGRQAVVVWNSDGCAGVDPSMLADVFLDSLREHMLEKYLAWTNNIRVL